MKIKGRKFRLWYKLTFYKENGEKSFVSRHVKTRIANLIKTHNCKMSVRVEYAKNLTNETIISDDKDYLIDTLNQFTELSYLKQIRKEFNL